MTDNKTSEALIDTNKSFDSSILDTNLIPIPSLRDDKDTLSLLPVGKPFFNYDSDIKELQSQIEQLEDEIWSIENKHNYFQNGSVIRSITNELDYYMQSGRRRQLNDRGAMALIKRRAGKKDMPTEDFVTPVSNSCIAGILAGPPINNINDLNTDLMEINRFDERQFEEEYQ